MKNMQTFLLILGLIVSIILAYITFMSLSNPTKVGQDTTSGVTNEKNDSADMELFKEEQAVSDDDSLDTIEAELDGTIILEEDFSDL